MKAVQNKHVYYLTNDFCEKAYFVTKLPQIYNNPQIPLYITLRLRLFVTINYIMLLYAPCSPPLSAEPHPYKKENTTCKRTDGLLWQTDGVESQSQHINFFAPLRRRLPILRSRPCLVIGTPVLRAIFCLACVRPIARFHENVRPGIFTTSKLCVSFYILPKIV